MKRTAGILALLIALAPSLAFAHPGHGGDIHTFSGGLMHPLTGLDHLLAAFAVGLWAVLSGMRRPWALPLVFVATMALAAIVTVGGFALPNAELMIAFSVVALGIFCAAAVRLPAAIALLVTALFGFAHGYAHGAEGGAASVYLAGMVVATAALHLAGMAAGWAAASLRLPVLARAAGALVAVAGAYVMVA